VPGRFGPVAGMAPASARQHGPVRRARPSACPGPTVSVWGTGTPLREFMYSEDMADACIHLMNLPDETFNTLLGSDEAATVGEDLTIRYPSVKEPLGF
jgi:nucleoside-diphosphate-sugar epimerase